MCKATANPEVFHVEAVRVFASGAMTVWSQHTRRSALVSEKGGEERRKSAELASGGAQ